MFWVQIDLCNGQKWVWKDLAGKPFTFISEAQASELVLAWLKHRGWDGRHGINYTVIPAGSVPVA